MKTPDEIKKAMECCFNHRDYAGCTSCPYVALKPFCGAAMKDDALAYIGRLEEEAGLPAEDGAQPKED